MVNQKQPLNLQNSMTKYNQIIKIIALIQLETCSNLITRDDIGPMDTKLISTTGHKLALCPHVIH